MKKIQDIVAQYKGKIFIVSKREFFDNANYVAINQTIKRDFLSILEVARKYMSLDNK